MRDIDLIWQGFWDARDGDIMANLGAYEELAAVTGKPIGDKTAFGDVRTASTEKEPHR